MVKIKLKANWASSDDITLRLLSQFKTSESDLDGIEFVYDDTYDVIVFFNYISEQIKPGTRAFMFPHEPTWSGSHQKSACYNNFTLLGYNKSIYGCPENVIETPAHTFYGGRGPWIDSLNDWCYSKSIEYNNIKKEKTISSIVTNLDESRGYGETCLYKKRYHIVSSIINDLKFIDYYGGWIGGSENIKTEPHKLQATLPYKFSLSIENEYGKNWISEKFYDPIICNTIPIYFGCSNIKEIYPEDGYILLENIDDIDYVRNTLIHINEHADEIYNNKLPELVKIKEKYFNDYNLLKKIKKLALEL